MKRMILAASLALVAFVATSGTSNAQIITAGFASPYYGTGYYPSYGYSNYGYNYGTNFSFSYGNAYRPVYATPFVGPRYYGGGYSNFNNGYRYGGYSGYRGRGYRR